MHSCITESKTAGHYLEVDWSKIKNGGELRKKLERQAELIKQAEEQTGKARNLRDLQKERTEYIAAVKGKPVPITGDKLIRLYIKRSFHVAIDKKGNGTLVVLSPQYLIL